MSILCRLGWHKWSLTIENDFCGAKTILIECSRCKKKMFKLERMQDTRYFSMQNKGF